ncbi:MAG: hypothetical protein HFF76_06080 [Oscillospiraceae bacterium]|jgi:hypothetical protein|nr:hypothetical protein [Oscillospiraceae bacterium]
MDERIKPTKSGLFAIELLIAVGVFSLCAAICVGLFVRSEIISQDSADLNQAVTAARSASECFKAAGGDLQRTAELTGGEVSNGVLFLEFDGDWQKLPAGEPGTFELTMTLQTAESDSYSSALLDVKRWTRSETETVGESFLVWEVAALEVVS